jgi:hypothetical protein
MTSFKLRGRFSEISMGAFTSHGPDFCVGLEMSDHPYVTMLWEVIPPALGRIVRCWIIGTVPSPYGPSVGVDPGFEVAGDTLWHLRFPASAVRGVAGPRSPPRSRHRRRFSSLRTWSDRGILDS